MVLFTIPIVMAIIVNTSKRELNYGYLDIGRLFFYFEETKFCSSFIFCEFDRFCLVDSKSVFEINKFLIVFTNNVTRAVATTIHT